MIKDAGEGGVGHTASASSPPRFWQAFSWREDVPTNPQLIQPG